MYLSSFMCYHLLYLIDRAIRRSNEQTYVLNPDVVYHAPFNPFGSSILNLRKFHIDNYQQNQKRKAVVDKNINTVVVKHRSRRGGVVLKLVEYILFFIANRAKPTTIS